MNAPQRVVVNVATGRYMPLQQRLAMAIDGIGEHFMGFCEPLPSHWPKHSDSPYAFKALAIAAAAQQGARQILWADSSIFPLRRLTRIWDYAEEHGAWISKNWWPNSVWTADSAYPDLFPDLPLDEAKEENGHIWHVAATAFAIDLDHYAGKWIFHHYLRLATQTDAFKGPHINANHPGSSAGRGGQAAPCGPPEVLGHRHDQTALSVLAHRYGVPLTDPPAYFAYPPNQTEETILLAKGML